MAAALLVRAFGLRVRHAVACLKVGGRMEAGGGSLLSKFFYGTVNWPVHKGRSEDYLAREEVSVEWCLFRKTGHIEVSSVEVFF